MRRVVCALLQAPQRSGRVLRGLSGRLVALLPVVRRVRAQVEAYAEAWRAGNDDVVAGEGPLWVVLGDSTAQGIGASDRDDGYVGQLRRRLEARDGRAWRVLNLSVSGGRVADVVESQLPLLTGLAHPPDLVTCAIGINDVRRVEAPELVDAFLDLLPRLPAGTLVADLPQGVRRRRTEAVNAVLREAVPAHGLVLVGLHAATGPPWRGKFSADQFHPNARGYRDWADAFAAALGLGLLSQQPAPRRVSG